MPLSMISVLQEERHGHSLDYEQGGLAQSERGLPGRRGDRDQCQLQREGIPVRPLSAGVAGTTIRM